MEAPWGGELAGSPDRTSWQRAVAGGDSANFKNMKIWEGHPPRLEEAKAVAGMGGGHRQIE